MSNGPRSGVPKPLGEIIGPLYSSITGLDPHNPRTDVAAIEDATKWSRMLTEPEWRAEVAAGRTLESFVDWRCNEAARKLHFPEPGTCEECGPLSSDPTEEPHMDLLSTPGAPAWVCSACGHQHRRSLPGDW